MFFCVGVWSGVAPWRGCWTECEGEVGLSVSVSEGYMWVGAGGGGACATSWHAIGHTTAAGLLHANLSLKQDALCCVLLLLPQVCCSAGAVA